MTRVSHIKHLLPLPALVTAHDGEQISDNFTRKMKPVLAFADYQSFHRAVILFVHIILGFLFNGHNTTLVPRPMPTGEIFFFFLFFFFAWAGKGPIRSDSIISY